MIKHILMITTEGFFFLHFCAIPNQYLFYFPKTKQNQRKTPKAGFSLEWVLEGLQDKIFKVEVADDVQHLTNKC